MTHTPPPSERRTEDMVREHFRPSADGVIKMEEQSSSDPVIARALKAASRHGGGAGRPEFIISFRDRSDVVLVVECKARTTDHMSPRLQGSKPGTAADKKKYACDGVLHYAKHLSSYRTVIAVCVSGQGKTTSLVSTYVWFKGDSFARPLLDLAGQLLDRLTSPADYLQLLMHDRALLCENLDDLLALSRQIHNFLRDYAKVTEAQKPLVISAALLALRHPPFRKSWDVTSDSDLPLATFQAVQNVVSKAMNDPARRELIDTAYQFIITHPELIKPTSIAVRGRPKVNSSPLRYLLGEIEEQVLPFADMYTHVDVIGQFYAEFLRYTGGDGRGLGIVLTPRHLTELLVLLADVGVHDTVIDPCAGTGGFLISAMAEMDREIGDNAETRRRVRTAQLIGIEQEPVMFALGASNMILRGDGKANLFYRGDCFDEKLQGAIIQGSQKVRRPNKGLINPPYAQKGGDQHELDFVKAMLDMLVPGGLGVAVVPVSCVTTKHPARGRLLQFHTLVAAMSLPDDLFYPVGAIPSVIVLRAHAPHIHHQAPTWFGYWKDDGFVKVKNAGRVDAHHRWPGIRDAWLEDYRSRSEEIGRCIKRKVGVDDEWCAEAYMETDYSGLSREEFERVVREYLTFLLAKQGG